MDKSSLKRNKKAQFYLFVALILCISAFGLFSPSLTFKKENTGLNLVSSNYLFEAKNIVNQALYRQSDPFIDLDEFTSSFLSYTKTKNLNFQAANILKINNSTKVVNYLKDELNITSHNRTIKKYESLTFKSTNNIILRYQDIDYNYTFTNDSVEFKALIINN